ncbi:hypothetical protein [Flavobacterium phycosphaerae]|uniref:hypothetical protein n=1 Tax=Flavobacterium phycosphaerae TaxID=2697515 RepID=UPI001F3A9142|nr:hypothetical protein [Flavobacterium phycosphaerae]
MRIYLVLIAFFMTFGVTAQNVETDFDAPDSLYREDQFYLNITYNILQKGPSGLRQNKFSTGLSGGSCATCLLVKKEHGLWLQA